MSNLRPVLVLVAGDPVPTVRERVGGFSALIRRAAGAAWPGPYRDVDLRTGEALPDPAGLAAVIVTGSASSLTERAAWMLRGEDYLRSLVSAEVPTFGICFGHQMLGQALGGNVEKNPRGREIGTVDLDVVAEDLLFPGLVAGARVNETHVDVVETLPAGATVLARTALDPHAAVRFAPRTWGVQFHPEMDADVVRGYIEARRETLEAEGLDPHALLHGVDDAPGGRATLERFLESIDRR